MIHYLNVCDIKGGDAPPVDLITFGSPCQDLSVAGQRAGLKHEANGDEETTRSGLFMEAVRIIKEMRESSNGVYPGFAVWENVPEALSSNKGEDFRVVIESLCRIKDPTVSIPMPKGKWANAGCVEGGDFSLAWRILDAKYFGVAQRRRRVFVVLDLAGGSAGKILFESEGLSGYTPQGFRAWEETAGGASEGFGETGCYGIDGYNAAMDDVAEPTYSSSKASFFTYAEEEIANTLVATDYKDPPLINDYDASDYIVRRLTPTECARLQGFPDDWGQLDPKTDMTEEEVKFWNDVYITHQRIVKGRVVSPKTKEQLIKWYNKLHNDANEYKMWGNGVALPCVRFIMKGLARHGVKTLASLFDGSGGFPLAGIREGIEPIWCSEIEPYPIAVTVKNFKGDTI